MTTDAPAPSRAALIDDNLLFSGQISAGLTRLGLTPEVIGSPDGAVERLAASPPVIILVNLSTDRLRPLEIVRAVKADPGLAAVPVIGFTGHTEEARIQAGRAAGCDRVVANSAITGDLPGVLARFLPPQQD
jgi:CheY-like chemotaxis protein